MKRRMLPIGTQSFRILREDRCYYVDKTRFIEMLLAKGRHFFLSRPRRFGKSLFVDTLKELFEGNEELFRGLHIHDRWDWSVRRPVIRLSFASGNYKDPREVHRSVVLHLDHAARQWRPTGRRLWMGLRWRLLLAGLGRSGGHQGTEKSVRSRFWNLVRDMRRVAGRRVVVLVDEYDKPILDALEVPEVARANRDFLRGLYGVIKDCDDDIRFTFITGVSKFSKVSLFSGLNSLKDITLDRRYSAICGYTDDDLNKVFAPELPGLDRDRIQRWYNGYNWRGSERVYNPFDILLLFDDREFEPHWIDTGASKFLIDFLLRKKVSSVNLEHMGGDRDLLSKFDVGEIGTEALLFQTGYLTITGEERRNQGTHYRLGYPNREVELALNKQLLAAMVPELTLKLANEADLVDLLATGDLEGLEESMRGLFESIPPDWHRRNKIAEYEGYYCSVVHSWFKSQRLLVEVVAEDSGSQGRADIAVRHPAAVYVFELKLAGRAPEGAALKQARAKGYAGKYRGEGRRVYLVGVEFSTKTRKITNFENERLY